MQGWGSSAWGTDRWGDPRITQPSVLAYGSGTGSGTSRTTASFSVAANRVVIFCCNATSGTAFPAEPPVLSGTMGTALTWNYEVRGHENGIYPRQTWMWSAFTGPTALGPGTITWTTTNSMSANAMYSVVQFEEGEVDELYPIVQPRGRYPDIPPDQGQQVFAQHHEMGRFADPRNGILNYCFIGAANSSSVTHTATGFTRLAYYQSGGSWASITQWKDSQSLLVDSSWPLAEGGNIAHYVSVAAEIRAAGTDTDVGRIRDRSLASGSTSADGTVFTVTTNLNSPSNTITSFRERDIWLAVTSARTAATPGQPTITDTLGWTWDLVASQGYSTIASPTQKLWVFHSRTGITDPGANVITITYPQTQTACAWQVSETRFTNDTSARRQTKNTVIDNSGAAGFTATFTNPTAATSAVMFFLAKADYDHTSGEDVLPGVIQDGFVEHEQATSTTPNISISAFACHTPEDAPTIALWRNADAAIVAFEFGFNNDTTVIPGLLDATPTVYTPRVGPVITVGLIDRSPQLFTPSSAPEQSVTSGGAFQVDAFQDGAFQSGTTGLFVDASPTVYGFFVGNAQAIVVPTPVAALGAFQTDTFQDNAFQQANPAPGINHAPVLYTPSASVTSNAKFVYLTGTGGWDSAAVLWDSTGHLWDEGNTGGIILHEPHLFTPAVKDKVTVPLLDATPTIYTPTANPKGVTVPLLNAIPSLFTPTANTKITMQFLDVSAEVYDFSFLTSPSPDLLDATPTIYAPSVDPKEIDPDLLIAIPSVFTPSVAPKVSPALLDVIPVIYTPSVNGIFPGLIDVSPTVYTPSLERIIVGLLDATPEIFTPDKVNLPVASTIRLDDAASGLIDSSVALFAPDSIDLAPSQIVYAEFIDGTPLLLSPRVIVPTRPIIQLRGRYDPVIRLRGRYDTLITLRGQLARQG